MFVLTYDDNDKIVPCFDEEFRAGTVDIIVSTAAEMMTQDPGDRLSEYAFSLGCRMAFEMEEKLGEGWEDYQIFQSDPDNQAGDDYLEHLREEDVVTFNFDGVDFFAIA